MEFTIEQAGNTEIATLHHNGQSFVALGSSIDLEAGIIHAYVSHPTRLTTFDGRFIAEMWQTGSSRGFNATKIYHYGCEYGGYYWHGKNTGHGGLIRMRKGRKL